MTNTTVSEQALAALRQIAALCPLHAGAMLHGAAGSKSNFPAACEIGAFYLAEEKGEGLAFACQRAEGGFCAGYAATETRE